MITWKNSRGYSYETFTVQELIEHLAKLPQDLPVMITWEGTANAIDLKCLKIELGAVWVDANRKD